MSWTPVIAAQEDSGQPHYVRIADAIAADVARGRLLAGQRLPGARSLAAALGVHRNTVDAAFRTLAAQGWIESRPRSGYFVLGDPGEPPPVSAARGLEPRTAVPGRLGYKLGEPPNSRESSAPSSGYLLHGGLPDLRMFPHEALARAYRRALKRHGPRVLGYGDARGLPELRAALAQMLAAQRGLATGPDDLVITRGSQMAIALVARAILRPGDRVGVESYGYPPAWAALREAGAELVPLPVDGEGLDVDALEQVLADGPLRMIYLTPHHQYPTLAVLSGRRRLRLLELARTHRVAVLEDDYDHEYHYEGRPVLPLAASDRAGVVIYVGTSSKVLAPGLRVGYVVAPRVLLARIAALRTGLDRQGDLVGEAALAELLEEGELRRHIGRTRRAYRARRDLLADLLEQRFGERLSFQLPHGGMALWVGVDRSIDPANWQRRARQLGVHFQIGQEFAYDGRAKPFVRLGYARVNEDELEAAGRLLVRASGPKTA